MGYIEETPGLFAQLAPLGVSAQVWDEVVDELRDSLSEYGESYHLSMTPPALNDIVFDLRLPVFDDADTAGTRMIRRFDFTRGAEESDREYVTRLLKTVDANRVREMEETAIMLAASGRRVCHDEDEVDWDLQDDLSPDEEPIGASKEQEFRHVN